MPPYVVFPDATLIEMATFLPQNNQELLKISGVGDLKLEKYGPDFLEAVVDYCRANGLRSRIDLKSPKRLRRSSSKRDGNGKDTYQISLEMFRNGHSIQDIAAARGLAASTIENHLCRFLASGKVSLEELVPLHKIEPIRSAILKFNGSGACHPLKNSSATITPTARFGQSSLPCKVVADVQHIGRQKPSYLFFWCIEPTIMFHKVPVFPPPGPRPVFLLVQ